MTQKGQKYNVGGLMLPRPFKARRLGHFGLWQTDLDTIGNLYVDLLGFRHTDSMYDPEGRQVALFTSHGTDHHSLVAVHPSTATGVRKDYYERGVLVNQISFQVCTLEEVVRAHEYFVERQVPISRIGRDYPGSNWALYVFDPDGHRIELFYGMEQIGWSRRSKPKSLYDQPLQFTTPKLPQRAEITEILAAENAGVALDTGFRPEEKSLTYNYCVGGIMLPRPFNITKIGPISIFVTDVDASEHFYVQLLGLSKTEEVHYRGNRCVFLRVGTDHHCLTLLPVALRSELRPHKSTTLMSLGVEVGSYSQLKSAVDFLRTQGLQFIDNIPPELHPGVDYAAYAVGPDGHCIQLYFHMDQLGWDGKPRSPDARRRVPAKWPDALDETSDYFTENVLQGPIA